jgi:two-component system LytT family response regulator
MIMPRHGVLIVDDEALARQRIRQLLHATPDFEVVGECSDARQVVSVVCGLRPVVCFLDIRMPHLDGFAVQEAIRSQVRHVVFITAHSEFAARAFDVAASDYLVKPVTQARFNAALARMRATLSDTGNRRVLLGSRQGGATVDVQDVAWIEADGAYVNVHVGGKRHVLRESLSQIIDRLGPADFIRIHRSAGINLGHLRALKRGRVGLEVELSDGTRIPISRRKAREVVELLRRSRSDHREHAGTAQIETD